MPFPEINISEDILQAAQMVATIIGAYFLAVWLSLAVWAFMDIRSRTNDVVVQAFAVLLVLGLSLPGLLLYFLLRPQETLAEQYRRSLEEEALLQDLEKLSACPACKRAVKDDYLLCPYCQSRLKQPCKQCGQPLNLTWKACPYCATAIKEPQPATGRQAQQPTAVEASDNVRSGSQTSMTGDQLHT